MMRPGLICLVYLPVDLFRLMIHSWRFMLGGYFNRFTHYSSEQPCIFCIGHDTGQVPRNMADRIRYRNVWMARILVPELRIVKDTKGRAMPICNREGGHLKSPWYIPLLAVALLLFWGAVITALLLHTGMIPPEVTPFQAEQYAPR
jgi:hypothetical protein